MSHIGCFCHLVYSSDLDLAETHYFTLIFDVQAFPTCVGKLFVIFVGKNRFVLDAVCPIDDVAMYRVTSEECLSLIRHRLAVLLASCVSRRKTSFLSVFCFLHSLFW